MKSFAHHNATSITEAIDLLKSYRGGAKLNAGGTDLLGLLKDDVLVEYPEAVINIKTIEGLDYICEDDRGLRIGALATLASIASSPIVKEAYNALSEAALSVASVQVRHMGTIGGNLCQEVRCWYYRYPHQIGGRILCLRKGSGPCLAVRGDNRYQAIIGGKKCFAVCPSDTAIALTALDADLIIVGGKGERSIPVRDFYHSLGNALKPNEMLTEVRIPRPSAKARQTFLKLTLRKPIDFAIVSVATVITVSDGVCQDARIALGAVAPTPIRATGAEQAIIGKPIDSQTAAVAAEAAVSGARPLSQNEYKVQQTRALVQRALLGQTSPY